MQRANDHFPSLDPINKYVNGWHFEDNWKIDGEIHRQIRRNNPPRTPWAQPRVDPVDQSTCHSQSVQNKRLSNSSLRVPKVKMWISQTPRRRRNRRRREQGEEGEDVPLARQMEQFQDLVMRNFNLLNTRFDNLENLLNN